MGEVLAELTIFLKKKIKENIYRAVYEEHEMNAAYSWYLACHKRGRKNFLKLQIRLEYIGVSSFTPFIFVDKERGDRKGKYRMHMESLFPGYLFINLNPARQAIQNIESIPGFSHFIRFGNEIKPLREEIVQQVMSLPHCLLSEEGTVIDKRDEIDQELIDITLISDKDERTWRFCEYMRTK